MSATALTAFATVIVAVFAFAGSTVSIYLTKQKEREAVWRAKKLAYYEEFFGAVCGIVGGGSPDANTRFATAQNNLHLIGSFGVIIALAAFSDEISERNSASFTQAKHDKLWSRLVWEIRADLGDAPCANADDFRAGLWEPAVLSKKQRA